LAFYEHTSTRGTKQHKLKPNVLHCPKFAPLTSISMENTAYCKRKLPKSCGYEGSGTKKSNTAATSSVVTNCEDWGGITSVECPVTM